MSSQALVGKAQVPSDLSSAHRGVHYPLSLSSEAERGTDYEWMKDLKEPNFDGRLSPEVAAALERYRSDPGMRATLQVWLRRAGRYEAKIREVLEDEGLPSDLVYVAFVESGLDPVVRSRAAAVGMWQFVKRTGAHYGLRIDREVDERRDPILATRAAARFLRELHSKLGSWELAFAAYNMGYYGLTKSMRKYNSNDFWFLARMESGIPNETRHYVARIVAVALAAKNLERLSFPEVDKLEPWAYDEVQVPPGSHLKHIARAAHTSVEVLEHLNPSLKKKSTPSDTVYAVRIPEKKSVLFMETWSKIRRTLPSHRIHKVLFGETLDAIASRYGVAIARIRDLNPISLRLPLEPGTRIVVPKNRPRDPAEVDTEPVVVTVPDTEFNYPNRTRVFYEVTSRDSCARIATFFGVQDEEIARWNNVQAHTPLQPGMILQLFVDKGFDLSTALLLREEEVKPLTVGSDAFFAHHESQRGRVRINYAVKDGDTLTGLAKHFELEPASIARINRFSRNTTLKAGEEIVLYVPKEKAPPGSIVTGDEPLESAPTETEDASEEASERAEGDDEDETSEATSRKASQANAG